MKEGIIMEKEYNKLIEELKERFADINNEIEVISSVVTELEQKQSEIENKTFYREKGTDLAKVKADLQETRNELAKAEATKNSMLLNNSETSRYTAEVARKNKEKYDEEILNPFKEHVKALNELIKKEGQVIHEINNEAMKDFSRLLPYVDKKVADAQMYQMRPGGLTLEVFNIEDREIRRLRSQVNF